jgi:type I restriction enzyme R subunit
VDYFGLSDYLSEALDMFSSEDVEGALKDLKDEIPKLKNAHTRVMQHFKGMDLNDEDECILSLKDEEKRQIFQVDFQRFSKQMDIVLPDPSANPYLSDLKRLGKISIGARNLYRDEQLDITGAGEKVRQLIEEHVYSTGIDPKIPPVDLLAKNFKEKINHHKSSRAKASEIEHAIKHHIKINLEEDPEYYKSLSERLQDIIRKNEEKWEDLVQLLLDFRENIESERKEQAEDLGLTETEYAFHGILMAEITKKAGEEAVDEETHEKVKIVVQSLVEMMDEATKIVDFFEKWDEKKRFKKKIKRAVIEEFDDSDLVKPVTDRFIELAEVKFK